MGDLPTQVVGKPGRGGSRHRCRCLVDVRLEVFRAVPKVLKQSVLPQGRWCRWVRIPTLSSFGSYVLSLVPRSRPPSSVSSRLGTLLAVVDASANSHHPVHGRGVGGGHLGRARTPHAADLVDAGDRPVHAGAVRAGDVRVRRRVGRRRAAAAAERLLGRSCGTHCECGAGALPRQVSSSCG